ncbi:hypothetical protein [Lacinutrix algicola]|uniref:hypothetical protein n=1 Tax=Lacinutrix algicola TaxID=342954 RepID=UPI0006E14089|nr:hypothetical protein [Lacinutrix algicola]
MSKDEYTKSMRYEMLVRNAYNCQRGMRNGADLCFMQNAMTMERGETFAKHLGSFEKQFEKVKTYISKALLKASKTKPFSNESDFFASLNSELENLSTTAELMNIVNLGLDKIVDLKK